MYDFEAILATLNEHRTENLTYLSRHMPISVAIYDTLSKELVYLVTENPWGEGRGGRGLTERFIEALAEK